MIKDEKIKKPDIKDRLWEVVRGLDTGHFSASFFESLTIKGNMVILTVNYRSISQMNYDLSEYIMPRDYMFDLFNSQFRGFTWPDGFEFSFRFGPYNFIVVKSMNY